MSESMKPRFAVDLNEIERQIAQAQSVPAQPASGGRSDPLAELARIVGQDDPFQSLLANEAPQRPRAATSAPADDFFAVRPDAARAQQPSAGVRQAASYDPRQYGQPSPQTADQTYGYQAQGPGYDDNVYGQDYYDGQNDPRAEGGYEGHLDDYGATERPRSRKGLIAIGAVLGAAVLGGGAALFMGGSSSAITGEPPLIKATNEPIKVQPQNPGGVEIPNQNKQIYERSNQNAETKVVNRAEQPVDVKQAVRMNAEATGATAGAPAANGLNLGEPRKVRTVTIRPDGTVAQAEDGAAKPTTVAAASPAMTMPAAGQPQPAPQPKPAASTPAIASAPKPVPAAETPSEPSSQQKPQRVASAQPTPVAPAAATPAETASVGGFAVQLGLAPTEGGAQKALAGFQKKFPDLEGQPALIRKAEVNGNTIYRVRVGPMSRDDASTLCSKLQGQGGQCFVAKN